MDFIDPVEKGEHAGPKKRIRYPGMTSTVSGTECTGLMPSRLRMTTNTNHIGYARHGNTEKEGLSLFSRLGLLRRGAVYKLALCAYVHKEQYHRRYQPAYGIRYEYAGKRAVFAKTVAIHIILSTHAPNRHTALAKTICPCPLTSL